MINDVKALKYGGMIKNYAFTPLEKKEKVCKNNIFINYYSKNNLLKNLLSSQVDYELNPLESYLKKQLRDKALEDKALDKEPDIDDNFLKSLEEGYSFEEINPETGEISKWTFDKINNCYIKTITNIYGTKEEIAIPKKQNSGNFLNLSPIINKLRSQ